MQELVPLEQPPAAEEEVQEVMMFLLPQRALGPSQSSLSVSFRVVCFRVPCFRVSCFRVLLLQPFATMPFPVSRIRNPCSDRHQLLYSTRIICLSRTSQQSKRDEWDERTGATIWTKRRTIGTHPAALHQSQLDSHSRAATRTSTMSDERLTSSGTCRGQDILKVLRS